MLLSLLTALALAQAPFTTASGVAPFAPGRSETINLVTWSGNQLPKIYERSDQLPLTDDEVTKLSHAGFDAGQLVKMIEERRCACDASADGLIKLKDQGVKPEVISAISLHALPPNRALNLDITLDFTGEGNLVRDAFLYFFIQDGPFTRVLTANLQELLARPNAHETRINGSNYMVPHWTRRIELPGALPLKSYGPHTLIVATSTNPTLTRPEQLSPAEQGAAQTYSFDYPRSSLQSLCRLTAGFQRDPVLTYRWRYLGSTFECEWN
jgi:hypothetical protein